MQKQRRGVCGGGAFLSYLALEHNVAAATQNQALAALLFLYQQVLGVELPWLDAMVRAEQPRARYAAARPAASAHA